MSNNYILLRFLASDNLNYLLHAYECDHGFMSFNIIEELQEVDGKSPPLIGEFMSTTTARGRILFFGIPLLPIRWTKLSV
jgi:hypothetical protein